MARKAGTLAVALTANTTAFDRSLARAEGKIRTFGKSMKSAFALGGMAFGGAALVGAFKSLNAEMDNLAKRAGVLGISTDRYQQLEYAARRTRTAIGTVEGAMLRVSKVLGQAQSGNQAAADAFAGVGLRIEELSNLRPDELFDKVAKGWRLIPDEADRAKAATELFGKSGQELNNFLRDYLKLGSEAESRGLIFKESELRAAEKLSDAFTDLERSVKVLVSNSGFASWLSNVAQSVVEISRYSEKVAAITAAGGKANETAGFWAGVGRNAVRGIAAGLTLGTSELSGGGKMLADAIFGADETSVSIGPASREEVVKANEVRRQRLAEREEMERVRASRRAESAVKSQAVKEDRGSVGDFSLAVLARSLGNTVAPAEQTAESTKRLADEAEKQTELQKRVADSVEMLAWNANMNDGAPSFNYA